MRAPAAIAETSCGPAVSVDEDVDAVDALDAERPATAVGADELGHEVIGGRCEDLGRRALLGDPAALLQDDDLIAEQECLVDVVGDEDDGLVELALQSQRLGWSSARTIGSTAPKGSSIRRMFGSAARPRATPTRCCWPPESWLG